MVEATNRTIFAAVKVQKGKRYQTFRHLQTCIKRQKATKMVIMLEKKVPACLHIKRAINFTLQYGRKGY